MPEAILARANKCLRITKKYKKYNISSINFVFSLNRQATKAGREKTSGTEGSLSQGARIEAVIWLDYTRGVYKKRLCITKSQALQVPEFLFGEGVSIESGLIYGNKIIVLPFSSFHSTNLKCNHTKK